MHILEQFDNWKFYLIGAYPTGEVGGLLLNIFLAVSALSLSFFFGVILGYSRLSCRPYIKLPCIAYIELVRSTPLLLMLFWFYFFLPYIVGTNVSIIWSAIITLCIYAAAYQAEIVRAGIMAVPMGQLEVALASGLTRFQAMTTVVLPQAFKIMIPSFVSFFVSLFKDTSITYVVGIIELTQTGIIVSQRQPDRIYAAYLSMAIGYFIICFSLSRLARRLEKRIGTVDLESYRPDVCRDDFMLLPTHKIEGKVCLPDDASSR